MVLTASDYDKLKRGDTAPDFSLPGADGKGYSLRQFKGIPVLVVFMCNHCPYVKPKVAELNRIAKDFKGKLAVVGINANESDNYPEDSFQSMAALVKAGQIMFPYLHDETQQVAKSYGAVCTPDPFLFDRMHRLVFHSRIDDSHGDKPATKHELHDAIAEFLKTGKISMKEQPSMGCSIKWRMPSYF
ncbi:MAG: thioredoxin family protein [Nanoarchaeota archaeon]